MSDVLGPLFRLMAPLDPVWQGVLWGLPVGLLALLIYRYASNQAEITRTKNGLKANLLALRLFRDDLGIVLRTQGRIFRLVGRYLRLGLVPLAILLIPVVLLLVQLEARFAYGALVLGKPTLLAVTVDDSTGPSSVNASLVVSDGLRVETPPLRFDSEQRIIWRISALQAGEHLVKIHLGDHEFARKVWTGDRRPELLMPSIYRSRDIRSLGSPGESAIDAHSMASAVAVTYEPLLQQFAGLSAPSWAMFVSSLIFGFALRRPLGVQL